MKKDTMMLLVGIIEMLETRVPHLWEYGWSHTSMFYPGVIITNCMFNTKKFYLRCYVMFNLDF